MKRSNIFPRHSNYDLPTAIKGEGCYIVDNNGKKYIDGSGGAAVSCLGHSDNTVKDAIINQTEKLAYAHTSFFTNEPAEKLANLLAKNSPTGLDKVYLVSSGSEAVEASIKLAKQYFIEVGKPKKHKVISRRQSYHGNTLGALASGGNIWRRNFFEDLLIETSLISPCYTYRNKRSDETEWDYGQRVAKELEDEILNLGPDNVMAFIAETVVGATAGALTAVPGYFKLIREICNKYDVLLILDEVMCGMGRTGSLFACDDEPVIPDIITIAKGLGAGYQPIGAMICQNHIYEAIESGSGFFQHGHTYLGHPVACAASYAVLSKLINDNYPSKVREKGNLLQHGEIIMAPSKELWQAVFDNEPPLLASIGLSVNSLIELLTKEVFISWPEVSWSQNDFSRNHISCLKNEDSSCIQNKISFFYPYIQLNPVLIQNF